ncbi:hypothetical protein [Mycoplasmopsis felis]|uniref:hypothetical protein n=1 Tax=Mycoplasmopsis felis TaxID=33923 RepID=UPI002AFF9901|nr:hypothetical protein [Mycoplasmopsis felis]WQQ10342.1 hypothetical protein RRG49_01210 [Mycoplasmopsis felis]
MSKIKKAIFLNSVISITGVFVLSASCTKQETKTIESEVNNQELKNLFTIEDNKQTVSYLNSHIETFNDVIFKDNEAVLNNDLNIKIKLNNTNSKIKEYLKSKLNNLKWKWDKKRRNLLVKYLINNQEFNQEITLNTKIVDEDTKKLEKHNIEPFNINQLNLYNLIQKAFLSKNNSENSDNKGKYIYYNETNNRLGFIGFDNEENNLFLELKDNQTKETIISSNENKNLYEYDWNEESNKLKIYYKLKDGEDLLFQEFLIEKNDSDNEDSEKEIREPFVLINQNIDGVLELINEAYSYKENSERENKYKKGLSLYLYKDGHLGFKGFGKNPNNKLIEFKDSYNNENIQGTFQESTKDFEYDWDKEAGILKIFFKEAGDNQKLFQEINLKNINNSKDDSVNKEQPSTPKTPKEPIKPIDNEEPTLSEPNTGSDLNSYQSNKTVFVRPPFGARFKLKNNTNAPSIITIFDHLDSPGKTSNSRYIEGNVEHKTLKGGKNGSQEFSEFIAIPQVMNYFKGLANETNSLIMFSGDTNIDAKNFHFDNVFPSNINKVTNSLKKDYYTSLNTKGGYANPYDKMYYINGEDEFYDTVSDTDNPNIKFKVDIYKAFEEFNITNNPENFNWWTRNNSKNSNIRSKISDHAPVFTDIKLKHTHSTSTSTTSFYPKENNTLRISHWNILNYGNNNSNYETEKDLKILSIASIIKQSGFDITGLTEINNGAGDSVDLILKELNKNNGNYKSIKQPVNDTEWAGTAYKHFDGNAQEQVVIIYNADVLVPTNFEKINQPSATFKELIDLYGTITVK